MNLDRHVSTAFVILLLMLVLLPGNADCQEKKESAPYNKNYIGETTTHIAGDDDIFVDLARKNGLGYVEMRAANPGIDPWLPGKDQEIVIPSRHLLPDAPKEGIVINLPEMRLYFFPEDGGEPSAYSIGIGREGFDTPTGRTVITSKKENPEWRPTKRMREEDPALPKVVPPGPENPLGTHALYLGWPQYRIHGTNKPYGIGRRVSSGCIRLYPEGIVDLYAKVKKGMPVTVVDQPVKAAWIENILFVEAHPTTEQANSVEIKGFTPTYRLEERDLRMLLRIAGKYTDKINWPVLRRAIRERRGYPVAIANKHEKITSSAEKGEKKEGG